MEGRSILAPPGGARRLPAGPALAATAAAALLVGAYALGAGADDDLPTRLGVLVVGFPFVVGSAFLAARRPWWNIAGVVFLMAFTGTLAANYGFPAPLSERLIWLLLIGLLAAMVAGHLTSSRARGIAIWPGIAALSAYVVLTALQIPFAETTEIGARAFFAGPAFMLAFFALAYSQWTPATRWKIARAFVVVAIAAGAYALYRLIAGHTQAELEVVRQSAGVAGDLSLLGSFGSRQQLGAWAAIAIPMLFALTLTLRGRSRLAAGAALALVLVALLGSEVRIGLIAAAFGIVVAAALFQAARGLRGEGVIALFAVVALGAAGMVTFALTIGSDPESTERYENILTPGEDYSFQRRVQKWDLAMAEINDNPLGQGLGTTGTAQRVYSHTVRLDNYYIDNSYLQLGTQQGYPGWILFGTGILLTGYLLVRSSVSVSDRRLAALGIGAAASLAAWLVLLISGDQFTHWGALLLWMLLGLGVGGFVTTPNRPRSD